MIKDEKCKLLCTTETIPAEDAKFINSAVMNGYAINWIVDGLPAATEDVDQETNKVYYSIGFRLGTIFNSVPYLHNHYNIKIHYHTTSRDLHRVVGVIVTPESRDIRAGAEGDDMCLEEVGRFHLNEDGKSKVTYTYSVSWTVNMNSNKRRDQIITCSYNSIPVLFGQQDGMAIFMSLIPLFTGSL